MSFTSEIKNETSMLNLTQSEKIAELSAFIRSNGKIFDDYIELYTENIKIAKRMFSFIKDLYNVNCEIESILPPTFFISKFITPFSSSKILNFNILLTIIHHHSLFANISFTFDLFYRYDIY